MIKQSLLLLLIWLQISLKLTTKIQKCDDDITITANGTAYWKFRGARYTTSEDYLCWKNKGELFIRECNPETGLWQPENVTCEVPEQKNKFCPEELLELSINNDDFLCLKISSHQHQFNESFCHGSNVIVPLDLSRSENRSFMQYLDKRNVTNFWLPLRRENNTMPYTLRLPGKRWRQVIDDELNITDYISDMKCMSARANEMSNQFEIVITDCNEELFSICVFQDNLVASSGCPTGLGALSYRPNECIGVEWTTVLPNDKKWLSFNDYYMKRNALKLILKKFIPRDYERNFFQVANYMHLDSDFTILINQNEHIRIERKNLTIYPVLFKDIFNIQPNVVQLILKKDAELEEFILIVYNRKYLWRIKDKDIGVRCFTNADFAILRTVNTKLIWENKSATKSIYKLKLFDAGPGEYWCEGHTISNFQLISTPRTVAAKYNRGHTFSLRINESCILTDTNTSINICNNIFENTKKFAKHFQKQLIKKSKTISNNFVIRNTRIMSIEQISTQYLDCWIHLTTFFKKSVKDKFYEDDSSLIDDLLESDSLERKESWSVLKRVLAVHNPNDSNIIRSTEYCFNKVFRSDYGKIMQWKKTARGQMGTLSSVCLQSNGMPYTRECVGNFLQGANWKSLNKSVSCQLKQNTDKITKTLFSLENSELLKNSPEKVVKRVKNIFKNYAKELLPADIHYAANILQSYVQSLDQSAFNSPSNISVDYNNRSLTLLKNTTYNLMAIYNSLVTVDSTAIHMSARLNSTNKLLEAFEVAMNTLSLHTYFNQNNTDELVELSEDFDEIDYDDIGVSVKASANLLYFVIDPSLANVTGIAMFRNNKSSEESSPLKGSFQNEHFNFLNSYHTIEDFITQPLLQFATYVPNKLLENLDNISKLNDTKTIIVIKIYSNDKLFWSEEDYELRQTALGRVVSVSLPGHSTHLSEDLPLVFRVFNKSKVRSNDTSEECGYWNFKTWAHDGIEVQESSEITDDFVICQVSHLTPFAYLVGFNFTIDEDVEPNVWQVHSKALDIITLTGCTLSLLGISCTFITATIFKSWRKKLSSKVLLHLTSAIAIQMTIICFVNTEEFSLHLLENNMEDICVAIGASLHYSVLVQFLWMLTIAYLQFKRYVQVLGRNRPNRFFLKSSAFCWGVPIIPAGLVVMLDHNSFNKGAICYPTGYGLYFGIILPIVLITIANFIIFCLIMYNILLVKSNLPLRHTEKTVFIYQIRLSVLLFFLLGFTWSFGFLTAIKAGIVFSYLFCLTATLQGFVIFLYFIILDPVTRRMWGKFLTRHFSKETSLTSSSLNGTSQTF